MPLTQDRFIRLLEAAEAHRDNSRALYHGLGQICLEHQKRRLTQKNFVLEVKSLLKFVQDRIIPADLVITEERAKLPQSKIAAARRKRLAAQRRREIKRNTEQGAIQGQNKSSPEFLAENPPTLKE